MNCLPENAESHATHDKPSQTDKSDEGDGAFHVGSTTTIKHQGLCTW